MGDLGRPVSPSWDPRGTQELARVWASALGRGRSVLLGGEVSGQAEP